MTPSWSAEGADGSTTKLWKHTSGSCFYPVFTSASFLAPCFETCSRGGIPQSDGPVWYSFAEIDPLWNPSWPISKDGITLKTGTLGSILCRKSWSAMDMSSSSRGYYIEWMRCTVVLETKNPVEMMKPEDEALHLEDERQDVAPDCMAYADKTKRRLRSKQLPAVTYAESFLRVFRIRGSAHSWST